MPALACGALARNRTDVDAQESKRRQDAGAKTVDARYHEGMEDKKDTASGEGEENSRFSHITRAWPLTRKHRSRYIPSDILELASEWGAMSCRQLAGLDCPSHWPLEAQARWREWQALRPGVQELREIDRDRKRMAWRKVYGPDRARRRKAQRYRAAQERAARGAPREYRDEYA